MIERARKRFGQHFLRDTHVLQQIAGAIAPKVDDHLVEIGPGRGALTTYLNGKTAQFDLIELDRDLIKPLEEKFGNTTTIHEGDALKFDFKQLKNPPLRVVGNLPYNISTPLIFHLFKAIDHIKDMHFLLQKEVVDRLTAKVGSHQYNRLSVMTQYFCDNETLLIVKPEAFNPPPKVMSALVRLQPKKRSVTAKNLKKLHDVVREAFTYRRKTLSNSLKKFITPDQLHTINIDPKCRPQALSVEDYIQIANAITDNE